MIRYIIIVISSCLFSSVTLAQLEVSGSFHNLSKPNGGPVSTGDIIEIRAVISVPKFTDITRLRYTDVVPAGTIYMPNTLRAITNEGAYGGVITNTGIYTDAAGDDRGTITGTTLQINLGDAAGNGTGATDGGNVSGGVTVPRYQDRATIIQAAYQVQVTAAINGSIALGGVFRYRNSSAADIVGNVPARTLTILPELSCNGQGFTNFIAAESGGTFGSGTAQNRGSSANAIDFTYTPIALYTPDDGSYTIIKNSSPTEYTGGSPAITDKVFGIWDIAGDHTGTYDGIGNPPAGSGVNGGYMLLVNASYAPNSIFSTTVSGLMTNTTYTLSFWLRNICSMCGYNPATGNPDPSPGVKPNLAFEVNGLDLYTTGDLTYTGEWVEKSFTFNSGPLTSANITIKNNAPGGGGNDWQLDDISITSCLSILPVKISDFNGNFVNQGVRLLWKAEGSDELESFIVEYSNDGKEFKEAGIQKVISGAKSYSFIHDRLPVNKTYYRLKNITKKGTAVYSGVIIVRRGGEIPQQIKILKNPSGPIPSFSVTSDREEEADIAITDMAGKTHISFRHRCVAGTTNFSLPAGRRLSPGIYIVRLNVSGKQINKRLVVTTQ